MPHSSKLDIEHIRQAITGKEPILIDDPGRGHAAVALILRWAGSEAEVLFIERAQHSQDPWSGNLAFPGGRIEPDDGGARRAAERETLEEIGLDLSRADYLGQLDDIVGAYLPVRVSCFVYVLAADAPFAAKLNHEVSQAFFFPLADLLDPTRHINTDIHWNQGIRRVPAIILFGPDRPLLWGITYRLICQFMEKLRTPLTSARP
jgi:8-oxo-dGTP pyrophosphatase MutT (NUDIX family)